MKQFMPQEIEVWYLIPALRKELARIFIRDYGMKQNKIAEMLGITGAAVSQYLKSKRGNEMSFSESDLEEIKKIAKEIADEKTSVTKGLYKLCNFLRETKAICELHKNRDTNIPNNCDVCFN